MSDAELGGGWIKDRLARPTFFHGLCHAVIAFLNYPLGAFFVKKLDQY